MGIISLISVCIFFPVCLCSSSQRNGRLFSVMLIIVHGELNCCDKLFVQRKGANNDSLSPLIGLFESAAQRRFSFSPHCSGLKAIFHWAQITGSSFASQRLPLSCKVHTFYSSFCCLLCRSPISLMGIWCAHWVGVSSKKQAADFKKPLC